MGPGAPPSFTASTGSIGGVLTLTSYTQSSNVVTLTFNAIATPPSVGSIYVLSVPGTFLDSQRVIVLSSPAPTTTTFSAEVTGTGAGGTIVGIATPTFFYGISSITQYPSYPGEDPAGLIFLLSNAPGSASPGNNLTVYYNNQPASAGPDPQLVKDFNSGNAVYVYIANAVVGSENFNGVWQVTGIGQGIIPGHDTTHTYFTISFTSSGSFSAQIAGSTYRETLATLTVNTPISDLTAGTPVTITGATPSGWNNTWTIVESVNGGQYTITSTGYNYTTMVATYGWEFAGTNNQAPVAGNLITVTNATNNAVFNGTFVIATVVGSTFTVNNIVAPPGIPPGQTVETNAQAVMFGTVFTFDPGATFVGTNTNVIYGNDTGTGQIAIIGGSLIPIGAGTRQATVFFITESGYETAMSPPVTFTTSSDANTLLVSNIPIGPPNVIARGIAITEAGANGVPGANFYVIPDPVVFTVGTTITTYTSTVIRDNTSTTAQFSFTDAVLLNSDEVDVQGNDLFNLIELGSSAWCVPYASRMFYGMQLNKVDNFNNLTFDGGYLPTGGNLKPLGWSVNDPSNTNLLLSPVTGQALYINNGNGVVTSQVGLIYQTAYVDPYQVAIIQPNTLYSVRVAASNPSGNHVGSLIIDLTDFTPSGGFGTTYGSFSVPLASMTTNMAVFSGTLLVNQFTQSVSKNLQLRVYGSNLGVNSDILVDRIEVYPTLEPYLMAQVYGSYVDDLEAIDASGTGGIIDTTSENAQTCFGGFVMHDQFYLLKQGSMYSTQDVPTSEPGGWGLREVSNRIGTCGIHAYDSGEEWAVMACRQGIYAFNGGQPMPIAWEIIEVWNAINWDYGYTIVLRNDVTNKMMYCAVPLPTGTNPETGVATKTVKWLPNSPYVPAPTSPNVMLVLNYQALDSFEALVSSPTLHVTMFGSLAGVDMKRKWTVYQIPSPAMDFITRQNGIDMPLFIGNGIGSSKIYEFDDDQHTDDGATINGLYTSYGHVSAVKAATLPIFGMHRKQYTIFQTTASGGGTMQVRMIPNILNAKYPYTIPNGIALTGNVQDDYFRPLNITANRIFIEWSTNGPNSWMEVSKSLLSGMAAPHSPLNPTGGGNTGITSTQQIGPTQP